MEQLGEKPAYSWDEACVRYIREKAGKKSLPDDFTKIRYLTGFFSGRELRTIKRDEVLDTVSKLTYVSGKKGHNKSKEGLPVSVATRNR